MTISEHVNLLADNDKPKNDDDVKNTIQRESQQRIMWPKLIRF